MGQYHAIYNITKKEMLSASALGDGVKLGEFSGGGLTTQGLCLLLANSNGRGGGDFYIEQDFDSEKMDFIPLTGEKLSQQLAIDEVSGRWAGDKIVIQGDYAEKGDRAFISKKRLAEFTDISDLVARALLTCEYNLANVNAQIAKYGRKDYMVGRAVLNAVLQ